MIITCSNYDEITHLRNMWKKDKIVDSPFLKCLIFKEDDFIISYLLYSVIYDRLEIEEIYVHRNKRHMGIGSQLLGFLLDKTRECSNITLEVNKTNKMAIKLYQKFGFTEVALRKNYYDGQDGLLMMKKLGGKDERDLYISN